MFENSVKIKPIVYRFPRMIWSVNQIELFGFFTDLGILTSPRIFRFYSPRVQKRIVDSPTWSAEQNISQAGKSVFHKIPAFPVMSLTKILETFIRSFPSSFNRKYVHMVACTVVFVGPACFVQRLSGPQCYLSSFQLFKQKRWSRGRFNRFLPLLVKDPFV